MKQKYLLTVLFLLSFFIGNTQSLDGVYSIGGLNPNYSTFNAAVLDLNTNGVSGAVTFNVRPGIYNEQIKISQFPGSSTLNTVEFKSETGITSDVVLEHEHPSYYDHDNYTLYIDGADNIYFRNITFKALPEFAGDLIGNRVIYIVNNSNNVIFEENEIRSWGGVNDSENYNDCIFVKTISDALSNDSIEFRSNLIIGGYSGIHISSVWSDYSNDIKITDNVFLDQGAAWPNDGFGINVENVNNLFINGNTINSNPVNFHFTGIYTEYISDTLLVNGNYLNLNNSSTGIWITSSKNGVYKHKVVSNNMISIGPDSSTNSSATGIRCGNNFDTVSFVYNSINIHSLASNSKCFYGFGYYETKNNQFNNHGGVGMLRINPGDFISNFNNYNVSSNQPLVTVGSNSYNNVLEVFTNLGTEESSTEFDPLFLSDTILIPFNLSVYDTGTPINLVSNDFYSTQRSLTTPDIGAYEGVIIDNDAGIINCNLNTAIPCVSDSVAIYIDIMNFGNLQLTNSTLFFGTNDSIYFQYNWSGNLNTQASEDSILIGYLNLLSVEGFNFKSWTENPNSTQDLFTLNDTLFVSGNSSLVGTYTIGQDPTNHFSSLTEATNHLNNYGICGPVVFNINPGVYMEQVIINNVLGSDSINTITFQSSTLDSSDVTIQYGAISTIDNHIFDLNGAKYIHIKHITMKVLSSDFQQCLYLHDHASNILISHCQFIGQTGTAISENNLFFADASVYGEINNIEIEYCTFLNGGRQIVFLCSNLSAITNISTNNKVRFCILKGYSGQSILFKGQENGLIENNTFIGERYFYPGALWILQCGVNNSIVKNNFTVNSANKQSVMIEHINGSVNEPLVFKNNFISNVVSTTGVTISLNQCNHIKMYNNTITHYGPGRVMSIGSYTNFELKNNIFYNDTTFYLIRLDNPIVNNELLSDYNAFYNKELIPKPLHVNGVEYSILQWTTNFGLDSNSIFTPPFFISNLNLHQFNTFDMNGAGLPLSDVIEDIDGQSRNTLSPDIGADEFDIDLSTFHDLNLNKIIYPDSSSCIEVDSLVIQIINNSAFQVNSFNIKWSLFSITRDSSIYNIVIPAGDSVIVNLGYFNFNDKTEYNLKFEVSLPNSNIDTYPINDSKQISYSHMGWVEIFSRENKACSNEVELFIKQFPRESILWSTGETTRKIFTSTPGTYTVIVTDEAGCTVSDSILIN